jgi:hypothetical protein
MFWREGALEERRKEAGSLEALSGTSRKRREREWCLAAERKRCCGELANRILGQGMSLREANSLSSECGTEAFRSSAT